jgi:hypothetical protein
MRVSTTKTVRVAIAATMALFTTMLSIGPSSPVFAQEQDSDVFKQPELDEIIQHELEEIQSTAGAPLPDNSGLPEEQTSDDPCAGLWGDRSTKSWLRECEELRWTALEATIRQRASINALSVDGK